MPTRLLLSLALVCLLTASARAGGGECHDCGGDACARVCRLVKTTKTVETICYGCKGEEICIPGPSKICRKHSDCAAKCDLLCKVSWTEWIPGCAKRYDRKRLTKYVVRKEVPSYRWVIEDLCDKCEGKAEGADIEPGSDVPPPPPVEARLKYGNPYDVPVRFER